MRSAAASSNGTSNVTSSRDFRALGAEMLRQAMMRPLGPAMGTAAPTTPIANSESLVAYALPVIASG